MPARGATARRIERELHVRSGLLRPDPGVTPALATIASEVAFSPGDVLWKAGDPARDFYAAVRGDLELHAAGRDTFVHNGAGVGLVDVLSNRVRSATAVAAGPVRAMRIRGDDYLDFLELHFELLLDAVHDFANAVHEITIANLHEGRIREVAGTAAREDHGAPRDIVERLELLADSPHFAGANVQSLVRVASLAECKRVRAAAALDARAPADDTLYLIGSGRVEARHRPTGVPLGFARGDLIGGAGALAGRAVEFEATAVGDVDVLAISVEDLFDVMEEHFGLAKAILTVLVEAWVDAQAAS